MSQTFDPLEGTDTFAVSYGQLNSSIDAAATWFIGPTAPPIVPGRPWVDTTADLIRIGNEAGDDWETLGRFGTITMGLLSRQGGTMEGAIDMNGQALTGLPLGTGLAAARQQEVDLKAPLAAPALTGDAQINQDPAGNNSITRRSWTDGRYIKLSGGTLTGQIALAAFAGADYDPVALLQLETFVGFNLTTGHRHDGADARKVRGADIDSGAAAAQAVLTASGSGASAYVNAQIQPMRFLETPVQLFNGNPATSYQTVDVSANTDADAYAAILRVYSDIVDSGTFRFRKNGSAIDTTALDWGPITGQNVFAVQVELDASRLFQWRALASVNINAFKIHLVGYMRKNF